MAKKTEVVKKTKKKTATTGEKPVVKTAQTKSAVTREPAGTAKAPVISKPGNAASKKPLTADDKNHVVVGKVTYPDSTPATGLTVIAYDKDVFGKDRLGQPVVTNELGAFAIPYSDSDFRRTKKERGGADVIVCVYGDDKQLLYTSKKKNNAPAQYELNITVPVERFVVRGKVTDANQKPLANLSVQVFDRDLRHEEFLDKTATDAWGNFRFVLASDKFIRADSIKPLRPELIVRVFDEGETKVAESARVRPEDHEVVIDLIVPVSRLSEWEILAQEIIPLLIGQGKDGQPLPPWEINDDDVAFLVEEAGLEREQVRMWAAAAKMAHEVVLFGTAPNTAMELASVGHSATSGPQSDALEFIVFYGWLRDEQPQDFTALLSLGSSRLLASLDHAIAQHYIPDISMLKERMQAAIDARQISEALKPAPEGEPASLGGALRTMPLAAQLQLDDVHGLGAQIVSVMLEEPVQGSSQWQQIRDLVTDDNLFNSVLRTIGLMQLTGGHVPLMQALQLGEVDDAAASLADLVKHDRQQWIELAKEHGTPKEFEAETEELRAMKFGQQIAHSVELMHPAPFINHRLLTGQIPIAEEIQKPLTEFLSVNPSMRIKDGSVLVWLDSDMVQTGSLSADQIERLTPELLKLERVARITPSLEYVGPMLKLGYESGRDIVQRHSREVFVNEMRDLIGSETEAGQIHDAAAGVVATAEALVLTYSPRFSGIDLPVMPSNVGAPAQAPQGAMVVRSMTRPLMLSANLQQLFGSQDYCECAHGASLYGPAAYLADLLHTLALGPRVNGKTALDVLLERRPDLAEIDLTGDNTDIVLPYIDLVLEILEAPGILSIPSRAPGVGPVNGFDSSLSNGTVPDAMKNDPNGFAKFGLKIGDDLSVRGPASGPWRIRDNTSGVKYRLTHSIVADYYDLAIFPQSVTGAVKGYRPFSGTMSTVVQNVGATTFPWSLPFDVARDEANTWLAQLGATRSEVMQAISADGWSDIDSACEYQNIGPSERRVFVSPPAAEHADWGFSTPSVNEAYDPITGTDRGPGVWHELLKNVSLLRSRARLTHRELLNVLETRFVRTGGARLEITGDECNTGQMRLEGMNAALARRIHIFVRLWRKLGWSTVDLDRAIFVYGIGTVVSGIDVFTDLFLRFVANMGRLHAASKLPVSQLLDMFGPPPGGSSLDITEYWDHTGALPLRTLSRFQQWFDNSTLGRPRQPEFQLNTARTELVVVNRPDKPELGLPKTRISDHLTYISAALATPESELLELLPATAVCIDPQEIGSGTADRRSIEVQDSSLKEIEIVLGAMSTGAVFSLKVQVSDSGTETSFVDVPSADLDLQGGAYPLIVNSATQPLSKFTYTGSSKYLRCSINSTSGADPRLWIRVRFQTRQGVVRDDLTLENLTALCRYALLRRIVGVTTKELRMLMAFLGANSLSDIDGPEKVLALLDARRSLETLSLSIFQADQILLGPNETNAIGLDERAAALLTTIRAEDQAIRDESTVADDKRSGLLKSVLTGLGWDERLISDVLGAEGLGSDYGDYEAVLEIMPQLPAGIALPSSLTYSTATKHLVAPSSTRPATLRNDVDLLRGSQEISGNTFTGLRAALQAISTEALRRVSLLNTSQKWLLAKKLPTHKVLLDPAPSIKPEIPAEWKGRFYYDQSERTLCLVGWITAADKVTLKSFEIPPLANSPFAQAIEELSSISDNYPVDPVAFAATENALVVPGGDLTIEKLLLDTDGLEARSGLVLERLLPEWRRQKLHTKLSSALSQDIGITLETAEALLELPCSAVLSRPSFESLVTDAQLLASNSVTKLSRTGFPVPFDAVIRVLVLGNLLSQLKMDAAQVPWLGGTWSGLNLTGLPTQRGASSATAVNWSSLQTLSSLITLRDHAAVGALRMQKILAATPTTASSIAFAPLATALGCREDTLRSFASADGLNISAPAWFHVPSQLLRLVRCLELADQMHMPASLFVGIKRAQLMSRTPAEAEAEVRALRQMALGKSTSSTWTDDERKVLDGIRQRRRDATVDYLVQEHGVLDANDLYGHYLIDPQMNPCMMTSRIKQAISSVQLFIQRCLMNLEPDSSPDMIEVKSWEKYFRMWEVNRKVLLYPENWIEPELREDKTPFFDDVVSSLQQGDATSDKAQAAVQSFLEKLSDLSRVDVVATCSSYDEDGYLLVTHVFARTLAEPHTYWHRQFIKQEIKNPMSSLGIWAAWQPVDLDVEGDHLFPFVWQGRLFLFWAIFSEEAQTPNDLKAAQGTAPEKYWRLKLAWSEFKSGAWSKRRLAQNRLLILRFSANAFTTDSFYFLVSEQETKGVTIRVYWGRDPNISPQPPKPLDELQPLSEPVSVLHFDGHQVRLAAARYKEISGGLQRKETVTFWRLGAAETPIDESTAPTIVLHTNMKIERGAWQAISLSQADSAVFVNVTTAIPRRSVRLLYSPDEWRALFSAPSPQQTLLGSGVSENRPKAIPFILSDWLHQFFVYPTRQLKLRTRVMSFQMQIAEVPSLHFYALDWPQASRLRKTLSDSGVDALLSFESQDKVKHPPSPYFSEYSAVPDVVEAYPDGDLEFSADSATAQYNGELFLHAPFSIACNLSKNQRFEEARRWFHYIFNPTDNSSESSPARYWQFRPFREAGQGLRIDELVRLLADSGSLTPEQTKAKSDFQTLIAMWKDQPFQPHLVARMRIRSYMYTVVMKYLDNLIAWGDQLFRRETLEALNEATQLYILAAQILGRRPEGIPRRTRPVVKSFSEFSQPDDLSNALVEVENLVPTTSTAGSAQAAGNLKSLYFCVPNNPKLLEYYDRVEDRLFKLRNCMNIDGVVRHLPLFEPAIDPSMLVRAAAAGVDVSAVLADLNAPLPFYRFNVMAQKATELCSEVKGLGAALLSAIEKGEAEALALMRSGHEIQMLQSVRLVKELQLHEAKANIDALGISLESAQKRFLHYIGLVSQMESLSIPTGPVGPTIQSLSLSAIEPLTKIATFVQSTTAMVDPVATASMEMIKQSLARTAEALSATLPPESTATDKVPMNAAEKRQLSELKSAHDLQQKAMEQRLVAQVLAKIPDFTLGAQGWAASPVVQLTLGGTLLSSFANFSASILDTEASEHSYRAGLHSTLAGYQRRAADWLLQAELAAKDIEQIIKQIAASNLRIAIASQELRNHDLQAENARSVDEFMHSKYSNRELYNWMSGQLSNLHFQAYQLAYDVAKRSERCFRHELGVDTTFIKFGYWDNLKKGLLAGENLLSDLKRMEVAYLNQNAREYEITKHISLQQLNANALLQLKTTGSCEFNIPEWIFDLDCPGHYMRRIKTVSVSIPCVAGPYTSINCTLSLQKSTIRKSALLKGNKYKRDGSEDDRFIDYYGTIQSIVTSNAQNDSGLFETNLRDERYLPFEGAGAESTWMLELPSDFKQFDYNTISDVIIHIRYTAREGGGLKAEAVSQIEEIVKDANASGLTRLFSIRHDFPTEWHRFASSTTNEDFKAIIKKDYFPYLAQSSDIQINKIDLFSIKDKDLKGRNINIPADFNNNIKAKNKDNQSELPIPKADVDKDAEVLLILSYSLEK